MTLPEDGQEVQREPPPANGARGSSDAAIPGEWVAVRVAVLTMRPPPPLAPPPANGQWRRGRPPSSLGDAARSHGLRAGTPPPEALRMDANAPHRASASPPVSGSGSAVSADLAHDSHPRQTLLAAPVGRPPFRGRPTSPASRPLRARAHVQLSPYTDPSTPQFGRRVGLRVVAEVGSPGGVVGPSLPSRLRTKE